MSELGRLADKNAIMNAMREIIKKVPPKFYADILYDAISSTEIQKSISDEHISIVPKTAGYVFRLFNGNVYWECSDIDIKKISDRVSKKIQTTSLEPNVNLVELPPHTEDFTISMKTDFNTVPLEEKLEKVREFYSLMQKTDPRVINPKVEYRDSIKEKIFVNTEGSQLSQIIPRIYVNLIPIVRDNQKTDFDYTFIGKEAGFELVSGITPDLIMETVKNSIDLTNASLTPSGKMPAIFDPQVAGLIAHESFGHGLEADQIVRDRSYLKQYYQYRVASDIVNISDSPVEPGALGSYFFDDEGVIGEKTRLIENGTFLRYIHSRLTASLLRDQPRGNGRRQSFVHQIYPRMSNTFFEPGDFQIDEMMKEMQNGVILEASNFGMEDPLGGGIQVTSKKGHLIENGVKTKLVKGMTVSGSVLELLGNVDAVSKGPIFLDGGYCGKGTEDHIMVSSGGVYVRVKRAIISPG